MFFAPFNEVQRTQNEKFTHFNKKLTFAFKFMFLSSLIFYIYNQVTLQGQLFANIPTVTFAYHEYWRIFTAPFATLDGMYGAFSVIISFWWFMSLLPQYVM